MKIIHIINSLNKGGAEGNLFRLCLYQKKKYKKNIEIIIITLIKDGFYELKLKKNNIKVISLDVRSDRNFFDIVKKIIKLRKFIKQQNPDVIQSWMYHSNFLTLFLQKEYYNKIFWNIRHSELNFKISKKITILISMICGVLSIRVPSKIIYCSTRSINFHQNHHFYSKTKSMLIYNGFDSNNYFPSKQLGLFFKKKFNIKKNDIVLGYAGRYAKQKNIESLLFAFSKIIQKYNFVYLFMVGKDINFQNLELMRRIKELNLKKKIFLLDEQKNLNKFYNSVDLLTLVSHSESFPNVVAESMLCSTPVLSSNAGCAGKIINNCGFVMDKNDSETILKNLIKIINILIKNKTLWKSLKKKSRLEIKKSFSIESMSNSYLKEWTF